MRVLVVEDEKKLGSFLRKGRAQENLVVNLLQDGKVALDRILTQAYGLGLSIAREIARAHGGDVLLVQSTSQRTEFHLVLPLAGVAGLAESKNQSTESAGLG